jgi:hypothetical protein
LGRGRDAEVLEMVGTVLELVPGLVPPGPGTEPEAVLELEMEAETEQGNKYFALHPYYESVVRRKTGRRVLITRRNPDLLL